MEGQQNSKVKNCREGRKGDYVCSLLHPPNKGEQQ